MELNLLNHFFVLLAAWMSGSLASRFGCPSVLGELLAGIALGSPLLRLLHGTEPTAVGGRSGRGTHLATLFVTIAAGVTSLATKSRTLVDLKLLDTRAPKVSQACEPP